MERARVLTDFFQASSARTRMTTKGMCPWSVGSMPSKSREVAYSRSSGNGLSMRSDGAVSAWLSMTAHAARQPRGPIDDSGAHENARTVVLVVLDVELGQEARGAHDDERRARGVRPQQRREAREGVRAEVVRDHERERGEEGGVVVEDVRGVGDARAALDAVVELREEADGLLRAGPADAGVAVEEEVDARVGGGRGVGVEDGEVADARQDEVLEDGGGGGGGGEDQDARGLERGLAGRRP